MRTHQEPQLTLRPIIITVSILFALILGSLFGYPQYVVYSKTLSGKAALQEAEYSRQILIQEGKAKEEAAKHLAKAEIERAKGVAEANEIIGASLKNNESYLRYLWIQGLSDGNSETIYVPTEANLPILEAGRFSGKEVK